MLTVIMLDVVMLTVIMLDVVMLTVIMLDVVMLCVFGIDKMSSTFKRSSLLRHKSSMNVSLNHFFRKSFKSILQQVALNCYDCLSWVWR
jgi:hypothetical protein